MSSPSDCAASIAADLWRADLVAAVGQQTLADYRDLPSGTLDLTKAHPSGYAQLFAGRQTRLGNLFREPGALAAARRRARAVRLTAAQLADRHGLTASHLAVGMLSFQRSQPGLSAAAARVTVPVLLRPVTLHSGGHGLGDDEIHLCADVHANPAMLRLLEDEGVRVNGSELVDLATGFFGFDSRPALDLIRREAGHLQGFTLTDRAVVGILLDIVPALIADLEAMSTRFADHPVVGPLAQAAAQRATVTLAAENNDDDADNQNADATTGCSDQPEETLNTTAQGSAPTLNLSTPRVLPYAVFDLDADQRAVVHAVEAGHSLRVHAPPGTGATRLMAQVIASAARRGQRVLLASYQQAEVSAIVSALKNMGLGSLVTNPGARSFGSVDGADQARLHEDAGTGENLEIHVPDIDPTVSVEHLAQGSTIYQALQDMAAERRGLHAISLTWGTSVASALDQLVALSKGPHSPTTLVRLSREQALRLSADRRAHQTALITEFAALGGFNSASGDSAWASAALNSPAQAQEALMAARQLHETSLPQMLDQVRSLTDVAGLREPISVKQWSELLAMLVEVRGTLDVFTPAVYERITPDMVAATREPSREEGEGPYTRSERRRWRKEAKAVLRPGCQPHDVHELLVKAERQRRLWAHVSVDGAGPRVPLGLAAADRVYAKVRSHLLLLESLLKGPGSTPHFLQEMTFKDLTEFLTKLAGDRDAQRALPRRLEILQELNHSGLAPLLADLKERKISVGQVQREVELCWWASALEHLLAEVPAIPEARADYERARTLAHANAAHLVLATTQGQPMCVAVSPLLLPQYVGRNDHADLVIIAGAHHCAVAEGVLAMCRGPQVLMVADPQGQLPEGLDLSADDSAGSGAGRSFPARPSIVEACADHLPLLSLTHQHRMPAQLAALSGASTWAVPAPDACLRCEFVSDGHGTPDGEGGVESVDAEVRRVVELVLDHARYSPRRSLAVIALSRFHARRIADAVRTAVIENRDVAKFFLQASREPFVVTDMSRSEDCVRDEIIVSIGFGRTLRGRVLHKFGPVDLPGGERALAVAASRARRRLTVVSCLEPDDLDVHKVRTPGARYLHEMLKRVWKLVDQPQGTVGRQKMPRRTWDPLLEDLAQRLRHGGCEVVPGADRNGWPDLVVGAGASAASPSKPVAVVTDCGWLEQATEHSLLDLVAEDCAVAEHLQRFGWQVVALSSIELFSDVQAAVTRVTNATRYRAVSAVPAPRTSIELTSSDRVDAGAGGGVSMMES